MADKSAIEWTDATWNPVTGCTKISPGCKFCYAERITERRGEDFSKVILHPDRLDQPFRWRKPRRIFVNSMSDLFHKEIPDEFIAAVWAVMFFAKQHTYQVLTKRPERMFGLLVETDFYGLVLEALNVLRNRWSGIKDDGLSDPAKYPLPNVWLNVSVESPDYYPRIDWLLKTPAAVRGVSLEPLLGPIDLSYWIEGRSALHRVNPGAGLSWCIVGGESGAPPERALVQKCSRSATYSRPCGSKRFGLCPGCNNTGWEPKPDALEWVRSIRDQCIAAGIPFFFKQWGGPTPKSGGRLLDGREWNEFPKET